MKNLIMIHGAWSSRLAWNYLRSKINTTSHCYEYDCQKQRTEDIVIGAIGDVKRLAATGDTVVVGHSLGGLIALRCANIPNVTNVVTVAAPIGGLDGINIIAQAYLQQKTPVIKDIVPGGQLIRNIRNDSYPKNNIHHVIASRGYSIAMPDKETDGVVSLRSQRNFFTKTVAATFIEANHHEILQHPQLVSIVKGHLL